MTWPPLNSYEHKAHRSANLTMHAFRATCDFDGYDGIAIQINGWHESLDSVRDDIHRNLELVRRSIPQILERLVDPSAWSFQEVHGIEVPPGNVTRVPVSVALSLNNDNTIVQSRSVTIACSVDDSYDVEPNYFDCELDDTGEMIAGQLND